jgi:hypothetical protein
MTDRETQVTPQRVSLTTLALTSAATFGVIDLLARLYELAAR